MSDFMKFRAFTDELPEDGQKIVYAMDGMPGGTMCTFRHELVRKQGDVFNYTAILGLDSRSYIIQILPENIDKFKWIAVDE